MPRSKRTTPPLSKNCLGFIELLPTGGYEKRTAGGSPALFVRARVLSVPRGRRRGLGWRLAGWLLRAEDARRRIPRLSGGARGERREEHARRARELRALPGGRSRDLHRDASLMRGSGTGSCSCNAARRAADQGDTRSSQERHPSVGKKKKKKGARCVQRAPSERACGQRLVTFGFASGFLRRLRLRISSPSHPMASPGPSPSREGP